MLPPYVISIILNSSRREDTLECLTSLTNSTYGNHKTIVLDNSSTDGSVEVIRSGFPSVEVIDLRENQGYAGNNNIGIEAAMAQGADWVFVLNEDTVLDPNCLTQLVEVGESNHQIGILGPMVYHHDEPDVIQSAGGLLGPYWESIHLAKDEPDRGQFADVHQVDWISGCGILVRRAVIDEVGMLDDRFFYFWEETEWCVRASRAGWQIVHVPAAKLWHKGVQRNYQPKPSLLYYATRNRFLLMSKHRAPVDAWFGAWGQTLRTLASWTVKPKWRAQREHRDALFLGMVDFLRRRWGKMPS
jgi:GT2 family glycosyltransferase